MALILEIQAMDGANLSSTRISEKQLLPEAASVTKTTVVVPTSAHVNVFGLTESVPQVGGTWARTSPGVSSAVPVASRETFKLL